MNKVLFSFALIFSLNLCFAAEKVQILDNQLVVDEVPWPQLFGAEIQYFRLRGGQGKNIPRAKVLEIWNRALDHAVEAGMNTVSFYIPWDFHEYKEGHFDFTGSVDEDGDGLADYPSRDVVTFIKMIESRGINKIMARPGPYINAEWGFLGFGAIPLWFHQKYPDSHMQNAEGLRTKLYDYHSPDLLKHTRLWFEAVHAQVLKNHIGGDGSIVFMQLDNETNFMWQSIYNHDYGPRALARYREFMGSETANPPLVPGLDLAADRSWYQFQDHSIYTYLKKLRVMWEEIGVKETQVIFTLAESYNAMKNGLLPNFKQRNARGQTGMMSLNLYPKTYDLPSSPLMNLPFKADHDVKAMDAASDAYLGSKQEWLMGPEIQGGWWRSTPVSTESRRQTYLSTLGHGLKAIYIYYFSEGDNWQAGWIKEQVAPLYQELRLPEFSKYSEDQLPKEFWQRLQKIVDSKVIVGIDTYRIMRDAEASSDDLYFDAPLDHEARPKKHFAELKNFGQNVIVPHQEFLARSVRVTDPVIIMKDLASHAPSPISGIDSVLMNSDWAGGLLGYLAQVGISAGIHHWDINAKEDLFDVKMIFHQDSGLTNQAMAEFYEEYMLKGGTVVSLLSDSLARKLKLPLTANRLHSTVPIKIQTAQSEEFDAAPSPLHTYTATKGCTPILWANKEAIALRCPFGKGHFIQIGALFYDIFNSDWYGLITDSKARINFLRTILNVSPAVEISGDDQVVAFARKDKGTLWLTVKSGKLNKTEVTLNVSQELLKEVFQGSKKFSFKGLMSDKTQEFLLSPDLTLKLPVSLNAQGSEAYIVQAIDD